MISTEHYFDWAATSPVDQDILKEALEISLNNWGNPSSTHKAGKEAKELLENARKSLSKSLNVKAEQLYFTSGGTESDQIALLSVMTKPQKGTVIISSIEHPAVREQALAMKNCGWNIVQAPCQKNGIINVEELKKILTDDTMLVCIMLVNNETGAIQPVYQIADLIKERYKGKRKPKFHIDCVQAAGKIPLKLDYDGIDSAAFSAHKICGPRGIGLLYMKNPTEVFLRGGGQEKGIRSGTENLFGAIAISKCFERYLITQENKTATQHYENQKENTKDFINKLQSLKSCTIIPEERLTHEEDFSPYVVQASFDKIPGNVMLRALDSKGFYISTGSACSSKKASRPILEAMHVDSKLQEYSVRFSFGPKSTKVNIDELFEAIKEINSMFNKE